MKEIQETHIILKLIVLLSAVSIVKGQNRPVLHARPCEDYNNILIDYALGRPAGEENQYTMYLQERLSQNSIINIKFDSEALLNLNDGTNAKITKEGDVYRIEMSKSAPGISMIVKGQQALTIPYILSIIINEEEKCKKPQIGILDSYILGERINNPVAPNIPEGSCGKRKISHTGLILGGLSTKAGDWPWHAAISIYNGYTVRYVCGGTLISKTVVLTAAHCVTIEGAPRIATSVGVVLGRYKLFRYDSFSQDREVQSIVVHEQYDHKLFDNDLAVIKLKSEASLNDYVQPACLYDTEAETKTPPGEVYGIVVGWGINENNVLSTDIKKVKLPIKTELDCIKSNPSVFGRLLTENKFCAGYRNGTSPCNGDSGGGFMTFIPDEKNNTLNIEAGSWYVRGIVSSSIARINEAVCDPNHYALFTDVNKFKQWILNNMD